MPYPCHSAMSRGVEIKKSVFSIACSSINGRNGNGVAIHADFQACASQPGEQIKIWGARQSGPHSSTCGSRGPLSPSCAAAAGFRRARRRYPPIPLAPVRNVHSTPQRPGLSSSSSQLSLLSGVRSSCAELAHVVTTSVRVGVGVFVRFDTGARIFLLSSYLAPCGGGRPAPRKSALAASWRSGCGALLGPTPTAACPHPGPPPASVRGGSLFGVHIIATSRQRSPRNHTTTRNSTGSVRDANLCRIAGFSCLNDNAPGSAAQRVAAIGISTSRKMEVNSRQLLFCGGRRARRRGDRAFSAKRFMPRPSSSAGACNRCRPHRLVTDETSGRAVRPPGRCTMTSASFLGPWVTQTSARTSRRDVAVSPSHRGCPEITQRQLRHPCRALSRAPSSSPLYANPGVFLVVVRMM